MIANSTNLNLLDSPTYIYSILGPVPVEFKKQNVWIKTHKEMIFKLKNFLKYHDVTD
ncbi:hypothetical protein [Mesomycoplasma ovipneumoniae]